LTLSSAKTTVWLDHPTTILLDENSKQRTGHTIIVAPHTRIVGGPTEHLVTSLCDVTVATSRQHEVDVLVDEPRLSGLVDTSLKQPTSLGEEIIEVRSLAEVLL